MEYNLGMPRIVVTISGRKPQPYQMPIDRAVTSFGRSADNDIPVECASISSRHCELERVPGGMLMKDLDSTNGIFLAGERMSQVDVTADTEMKLGDVEVSVTFKPEELAEFEQEVHVPQAKKFNNGLPSLDSSEVVEKSDDGGAKGNSRSIKREVNAPQATPAVASAEKGGVSVAVVLIGAVIAFLVGLGVRHYQVTGEFLLTRLLQN